MYFCSGKPMQFCSGVDTYVIKKERNGKSVSLGLHPRPRRR
jgi:hypothetical protein